MPRIDFQRLPDSARIWVFPLHDHLPPDERKVVSRRVEDFLDGWAAHGTPLTGGYDWVADRFLVVGVDQASVPPSGCSIDSMVRILKDEEARLGRRLVDHGPIFFRDEAGEVMSLSRKEFRAAAEAGRVTPETRVFDTTLTAMDQLREGALERPAREAWHGPVFFRG